MFSNIFPLYGNIVILAGAKFNLLSFQARLSAAVCDASFCTIKTLKKRIPGGSNKKNTVLRRPKKGRSGDGKLGAIKVIIN